MINDEARKSTKDEGQTDEWINKSENNRALPTINDITLGNTGDPVFKHLLFPHWYNDATFTNLYANGCFDKIFFIKSMIMSDHCVLL